MSATPHRNAHQAESITVTPAGTLAATDVQAALEELATQDASGVVGVAAGYKLARGVVALDGSGATSVAHGLTTAVAAVVSLAASAAPGDATHVVSCLINGANIDIYPWKPTSGSDPTLVASDGTENVYWIAVGT